METGIKNSVVLLLLVEGSAAACERAQPFRNRCQKTFKTSTNKQIDALETVVRPEKEVRRLFQMCGWVLRWVLLCANELKRLSGCIRVNDGHRLHKAALDL